MTIEDDSYYMCLCGLHVHRGAYLISLFGMVFHSIGIIGHLINNEAGYAVGSLISLTCYICVFYANKYERPSFYLPHIVLNIIALVVGAIFYIIAFVAAAAIIIHGRKKGEIDGKETAGVAIGGVLVTLIILVAYLIQIYFVRVVYRARHYMINVMQQQAAATQMPPPHFAQGSVNNIL